ncbi:MAG: hypothetical protein U0932_04380 [Thiobacillus sp.]|nr:hypothetical protein [Thiobacillus sp.]
MADQKHILMVAVQKPVEALRMASGLTLLDDAVTIATLGRLPESAGVAEQMEALEFAEVPVVELDPAGDAMAALARQILDHDVVYCV